MTRMADQDRPFLPFCRPSLTGAEIDAVVEVLRSGWITSGPRVEELEGAVAEYTGASHAVAVSSATAGFHILLDALSIGPGDEVITPSLTWPSAVNMIHLRGATPVFADIDPATWNLDPAAVEAAMTPRTRAVIPVHFAGQPADLDALARLCEGCGAILIEDAAHAIGTEHRGRRVGSGPGPAVFSFHAIKNLTTAEGGMIVTGDASLADRLRRLRFHGLDTDAWKRHGAIPRGGYDLAEPGWKYNLTDLQAAIGVVQLRRLEEILERRRALAARYDELLADLPALVRPRPVPYPARHAWHLYTVLVDRERFGLDREAFRQALRERQIGTGLHFLAVHLLDFYRRRFPVPAGALSRTEHVAARIVSLPLFPDMTAGDVDAVVDAIREIAPGR